MSNLYPVKLFVVRQAEHTSGCSVIILTTVAYKDMVCA